LRTREERQIERKEMCRNKDGEKLGKQGKGIVGKCGETSVRFNDLGDNLNLPVTKI